MVLTEVQRRLVIAAALRRIKEFTSKTISQLQGRSRSKGCFGIRSGTGSGRPRRQAKLALTDGLLASHAADLTSIALTPRRAAFAMLREFTRRSWF
jgi:hypothetical protein